MLALIVVAMSALFADELPKCYDTGTIIEGQNNCFNHGFGVACGFNTNLPTCTVTWSDCSKWDAGSDPCGTECDYGVAGEPESGLQATGEDMTLSSGWISDGIASCTPNTTNPNKFCDADCINWATINNVAFEIHTCILTSEDCAPLDLE